MRYSKVLFHETKVLYVKVHALPNDLHLLYRKLGVDDGGGGGGGERPAQPEAFKPWQKPKTYKPTQNQPQQIL
jgi:hypothetical protein